MLIVAGALDVMWLLHSVFVGILNDRWTQTDLYFPQKLRRHYGDR